jgi:CubicO group peptidase (beta-lactamase class C family)
MRSSLPRLLVVLSFAMSFSPNAFPQVAFPEAEWAVSQPEARGLSSAQVGEAIARLKAVVGQEGVAQTMLIRNGFVVWAGPDIDKKHAVWSCTKSFLSVCLGLLVDDGKCRTNDLASLYLPELAKDYPAVTLEHLATFTSGMHLEPSSPEPGPPDYPVGTAMNYNMQSDLLALILTKIAGESLRDLFQRRIGEVIGIRPGDWEWRSVRNHDGLAVNGGAGMPESGVHTNARTMARLGWLLANEGNWNGRQVLSPEYVRYATSVRVPAEMPSYDPKAWYYGILPGRYGLNFWVNGADAAGRRLWPSAPAGSFALQGNKNNICIVVPAWKLVLVRLAEDEVIDVGLYDGALGVLSE